LHTRGGRNAARPPVAAEQFSAAAASHASIVIPVRYHGSLAIIERLPMISTKRVLENVGMWFDQTSIVDHHGTVESFLVSCICGHIVVYVLFNKRPVGEKRSSKGSRRFELSDGYFPRLRQTSPCTMSTFAFESVGGHFLIGA
jgi:hypothetical protein